MKAHRVVDVSDELLERWAHKRGAARDPSSEKWCYWGLYFDWLGQNGWRLVCSLGWIRTGAAHHMLLLLVSDDPQKDPQIPC